MSTHQYALGSVLALCCLAGATLLAGAAKAASISVSAAGGGSCLVGSSNNSGSPSGCFQDNDIFGSDIGAAWSSTAVDSPNLVGVGSTSAMFDIDAKVAVDGGGDTWIRANISYDLTLTVDVDFEVSEWTVDLNQSVLGLYALRGDGTASAVGSQRDGSADVASGFNTLVDGASFSFAPTPSSFSDNPSNNSSSSQQFSGGRIDAGVLSGTGDGVYNVTISFALDAFSNDGCSGFICSSVSGGEEAALLFGYDPSVIDQAVDEYGTWGRSSAGDGYTSTWTLNVTTIPEPSVALLVGMGLAGIGLIRKRR